MRKLISILLICFVTLGMLINHADAKRFGGGRSFGYQRSASTYSRPRETAAPTQAGQQRPGGASRWLGPLAGFAAGGLLSYLLMGKGIGGGLLTWLAIAAIGFMIWNLIRSRLQPPMQYNSMNNNSVANNTVSQFSDYTPAQSATVYPAGFEPETFLREAKVQFIRLQAAYDSKNLADLREFTSPEVFGEIQLQLQERGDAVNQTEVVKLDAELLDVSIESQATLASVRFTGLIREDVNENPAPLNEIWHFRKYAAQANWVVAGVQQ